MAAALGVRKSVGTTSLNVQYNYILAYQRTTTYAGAGSNAMNLQVAARGFGLSRSTTNGPYQPGERVITDDDNSNTGSTPVMTYAPMNPRTHNWGYQQTAHMNLWGSSDLNASGAEAPDDTHPNCWTIGASAAPGHVAVGNAGGIAIIPFSVNSHTRIADFLFRIPILSGATNTFNVRDGWADVTFGSPTHGIYAEIDSNTNVIMQLVTRAASSETRVSSGITILANVWYRLRVVATKNISADYYIAAEGTPLPATPTATITTNIPSGVGQACLDNVLIELTAGAMINALNTNHLLFGMDRWAS
jgi:hypothetical protein